MNLIPSVQAMCLARIEQLRLLQPEAPIIAIRELENIAGYCETLNKQAEVMEGLLTKALAPEKPPEGQST